MCPSSFWRTVSKNCVDDTVYVVYKISIAKYFWLKFKISLYSYHQLLDSSSDVLIEKNRPINDPFNSYRMILKFVTYLKNRVSCDDGPSNSIFQRAPSFWAIWWPRLRLKLQIFRKKNDELINFGSIFELSRGRQICRLCSKLFKISLTKSLFQVMSSAFVFSWCHESVKSWFQVVISCQLFGSLLLLCSAYRAWPRRHCNPCQTFLTKSVATRGHTKWWLEKISTYWTFKFLSHFWIFLFWLTSTVWVESLIESK